MPNSSNPVVAADDPFGMRLKARQRLPRMMFDFVDGSTGSEFAKAHNEAALQDVKLLSRVLRKVDTLDTSTTFLGSDYQLPFGIAPMGMSNLISPEADAGLSAQALRLGIPHCVSCASSTTMEESYQSSGKNSWFQLYAGTDDYLTFEMVDRAQSAGYEHLVFTVDTPRHSRRTRDLSNGFSVPLKIGPKQFFDFATHPRWSLQTLVAGTPKPMNYETSKVQKSFDRNDCRGGSDWSFLERLRKYWPGKLIVKGVMSVEDALRIRDAGCDAVYVSNHGGRQLDSAPAAVQMLPVIRSALGNDYPIVFDSGVRSADDIVRALALGADFVMLGRPMMFALGAGGLKGLETFLDLLTGDLRSVMAQIGTTSIDQIDESVLAQNNGTDA